MNVWLAPAVALTVGVVTALLTGMQLITAKENKVSEFRQDWINDQRADLATALAQAEAYHGLSADKRGDCLAEFDAAQARVELRENPTVEEWTTVRAALDELRREMFAGSLTHDKVAAQRLVIFTDARPTLKANWTVVKRGEAGFMWFRRAYLVLAVAIVLVAVGWMLTTAVRAWWSPAQQVKEQAKVAAPGPVQKTFPTSSPRPLAAPSVVPSTSATARP